MSKFQVGEKVVFYDRAWRYIGVIKRFDVDGCYLIETLSAHAPTTNFSIHEKQIRRLKPRKLLRTFWVNKYADPLPGNCDGYLFYSREEADEAASEDRIECFQVLEVRRKK